MTDALTDACADVAGSPRAMPQLLVTRPQPQADDWVQRLAALGVEAAALPLLAIAPAREPAAVRQAWHGLAQQAMVMFVSPNAVAHFMALAPPDAAWPGGTLAAGTGPGTRQALLQAGVPDTQVVTPPDAPAQFDAEALWQVLADRVDWAGRSALIVRGENGRDWLAQALQQRGAQVQFVEAYRRVAPTLGPAGQALLDGALAQPTSHLWLLSSSEAVAHLAHLAPGADWSLSQALASHERIADTARRHGFGRVAIAAPTALAVAGALRAWPKVT